VPSVSDTAGPRSMTGLAAPLATAARFARIAAVAVLAIMGARQAAAVAYAQPFDQAAGNQPGPDAIDRAVEQVKADPNLGGERKIHTLRWRRSNSERSATSLPEFLRGFVRAFEEWSRVLVWVAVVLAAAFLAAYLVRVAVFRPPGDEESMSVSPSHVREMDIRPESLPRDIGGAARELWDQGQHRTALALLYRGTLSRLVHAHHVPVRDSSTEGDCLRLATRSLAPPAAGYVAALIGIWQRSVYGHQIPEADRVQQLCMEFDSALSRTGGAHGPGVRG
jgi:hypothetical protein